MLHRCIVVGMCEQNAKIVTSEPRHDGTFRQVFVENASEPHDHLIAGLAPEGVVNKLQIVQVEVDQLVMLPA